MKLLWVKTDFLHPTNRGGQIRTLETLKRLHKRHEVHYIAFDEAANPEGPRRALEYCSRFYGVSHAAPEKKFTSPAFLGQLLAGLVSPLPVAVNRWKSEEMTREIANLQARERFDAVVCDFLFPAANIPDLSKVILFQHNVEAQIWRRHVEQAKNPAKRLYFELQASRMEAFEREVCRKSRRVIAVSEADAEMMRRDYGVADVTAVPTGVDLDFFAGPSVSDEKNVPEQKADLVFLGSMDWMPNIEGIRWFVNEILPAIQKEVPVVKLAIVGRKPAPEVLALAGPNIEVTGTVADVRPWLRGSTISIVPLRVGGGTRLKIYESMAARVAVVSTTIGAEGLEVHPLGAGGAVGAAADCGNIAIADDPQAFAARCVQLLRNPVERVRMVEQAFAMVAEKYSWESVTRQFEALLVDGTRDGIRDGTREGSPG
jgi:polysaccharide biosynthesis protein PslH